MKKLKLAVFIALCTAVLMTSYTPAFADKNSPFYAERVNKQRANLEKRLSERSSKKQADNRNNVIENDSGSKASKTVKSNSAGKKNTKSGVVDKIKNIFSDSPAEKPASD